MTEDDDLKTIISQETVDINLSDIDTENVEIEEVDMDDIVEKKLNRILPVLAVLYLVGMAFMPFPLQIKLVYFILLPAAFAALIAYSRSVFAKTLNRVVGAAGVAGLLAFGAIVANTAWQKHRADNLPHVVATTPKLAPQQKENVAQTFELADLKKNCKNKLATVESKGFTRQDKLRYESLAIGRSTFDQIKQALGGDFTQLPEIDTMRAYRWDLEGVSLQLSFKNDVLMYIKSKPRYIGCDYLLRDVNNLITF